MMPYYSNTYGVKKKSVTFKNPGWVGAQNTNMINSLAAIPQGQASFDRCLKVPSAVQKRGHTSGGGHLRPRKVKHMTTSQGITSALKAES